MKRSHSPSLWWQITHAVTLLLYLEYEKTVIRSVASSSSQMRTADICTVFVVEVNIRALA